MNWRLLAVLGLLFQTFWGLVSPMVAQADEITHPQSVTVELDLDHQYAVEGTFSDGRYLSEVTVPHYAVYNGTKQDIFCIEPGVPIDNRLTSGYEKNPLPNMSEKAKLVSILWKKAGTDVDTHIVAQKMIWQEVDGYTLHSIKHLNGEPVNFSAIEAKINQVISEYQKKPSFHNTVINTIAGQSTTLTDENGVDLSEFDEVEQNTANVDFKVSGNRLTITPKTNSQENGVLTLKKSAGTGTPVAYKKAGQQSLMAGAIDKPNTYTVKIDVEKKGTVQIKKVDKESGEAVPNTQFKVEFSGNGAPATQTVKTDEKGEATIKDVLHGIHVKATEIAVPNPYVLGSSLGESDVVEGDVVAGQVITLTQRNTKAKGQILIEKQGIESGSTMWNENYTLAGNAFEIHKDIETGEVVRTITTDDKGHAETEKDLPLGTYVITEKTASKGFANTFKPVTVKIEYKDQMTATIIKGSKGTNQEVVGSTLLTKEDTETKNETQGRATFDGAVYGLFHKDGTPVKWSDNFKPVTSKGNKVDSDEIKFELSDKEQQASVEHLTLGNYFWQELAAPEGYQLDNTKHDFSIIYKDQDTKVIETKTTSKENVIKFSLDGFKYVDSKSGDVKSGYNGIEFTLNPIDSTKGEERKVTTETDENGYAGYWAFNDIPYGDYKMSEVKAPDGYKTIKDLIVNSKFDKEKREYIFTITEDGQNEAIKTLTVPENKINEASNVIHLSKLFLTNKVQEMPEIRTKATVNGEKTFTPSKETPMQDVATITNAKKGVEYTNKIKLWRVINDDYDNAEAVWTGEHDFVAKGGKEEDVIKQMVDTSKDDATISYVFTEELFIKDGPKVAEHNDLGNKDQTIRPVIPELPTIETLFVTKDGGKSFDPTKDQDLVDQVKATVPKEDIGKTFYYVTEFHKINKEGKETIIGKDESEHKATELSYEFEAVFHYKANMLKDGEKLVATHVAYTDKDHENEYAKHWDLKNEKQTLTANTPETPVTPAQPETTKSIPQTSGTMISVATLVILTIAAIGGVTIYVKSQKNTTKKR